MVDLIQNFQEADEASQQGKFAEARNIYQLILESQPDNARAKAELQAIDKLEAKDKLVLDMITAADDLFAAKKFADADMAYSGAMAHAAQAGIHSHHVMLEQKQRLAKQMLAWTKKTQDKLADAQKFAAARNWSTALVLLSGYINEDLPRETIYDALRDQVKEELGKVKNIGGLQALIDQASEAYGAEDFDLAISILKENSQDANFTQEAQELLEDAIRQYNRIKPTMDEAEQAYKDSRWADAFAILDELRLKFKKSHIWRRLWLRVAITHGQSELYKGKEACVQRNFKDAVRFFDRAKEAFLKVKEAGYESHQDAVDGQIAAADLVELSRYAAQAWNDLEKGNRDSAYGALKQAKSYLDEVTKEGREYPSVAVSINSIHKQVETELEAIRTTEADLNRAEKFLVAKDLQPARDLFTRAEAAFLDEQRKRAEEGRRRVEKEISLFDQSVDHGRKSANALAAVEYFQAAYERWPGGPEVLTLLEDNLVRAARQSSEANNAQQAARLSQRILVLNPENRWAKELLEKLDLGPQVAALIERVEPKLDQTDAVQDEFPALLTEVQALLARCGRHADLKERLAAIQQVIEDRITAREKSEALTQRAETELRQGRWDGALQIYEEAQSTLGQGIPPTMLKRIEQLRTSSRSLEDAARALPDLLERARVGYANCLENKDFDNLQKNLLEADGWLSRARQAQEQVKGSMLPVTLDDTARQVDDLRKRLILVQSTVASGAVMEALAQVRTQARLLGSDAILEKLEKDLQIRVKADLPKLLAQADVEIITGKVKQALETLRMAGEIDPANADIQRKLGEVDEHARLLEAVERAKQSYRSALSNNSTIEALNALRSGLEALRDAPMSLAGAELSPILQSLFRLAAMSDGMGLGQDNNFTEALSLIENLGKGRNHWAMREAESLADEWLKSARPVALKRVIASSTQLGNLLQAYVAACTEMNMNPFDEHLIRQEAELREAMIAKQVSSASKRLEMAREAFDRDDFEYASKQIQTIEQDYFSPVENKFPGLLEGVESVENVRRQFLFLLPKIEEGQAVYKDAKPVLDAARSFFQQNKYKEVAEKLDELQKYNLGPAPKLEKDAQDLRVQLVKAQQDIAMRRMEEGIAGVLAGLKVARSVADVSLLLADLDELGKNIEVKLLTADKQTEYSRVRAQVREEIDRLGSGELYSSKAQEAFNQGRYQQAVSNYRKALAVTSTPKDRIQLEDLLEQAEKLAEKENQQQTALETGQSHLEQGEFLPARVELLKARGMGADVKSALVLVSAGILYRDAEEMRKRGELQDARDALAEAREKLASFMIPLEQQAPDASGLVNRRQVVAEELGENIQKLETKVNKTLAANEDLRKKVIEARQAYALGNFSLADNLARSILDINPEQTDGLVIQAACVARSLFEGARDDEALGVLDQLTAKANMDPMVSSLRGQIKARSTVGALLNQAMNLSKNGEFQSARQALLEAAKLNPDPKRFDDAQKAVTEAQQEWERRTILPIKDALRNERYADAISLCKQAKLQVTAGEFLGVLDSLLDDGVNSWAEQDYKSYSMRLAEINSEAELLNLRNEIDSTLGREPAPTEKLKKRLEVLRQDVAEKTLRIRIDETQPLIDKHQWEVALARLQVIRDDADRWDAWGLTVEIDQIKRKVTKLEKTESDEKARLDRETALNNGQQNLAMAKSRNELIRAREVFEASQRELNLTQDDEFKRFGQEIREMTEMFDKNETAKGRTRDYIRQRRFSDASLELRSILAISPLQAESIDKLRSVVKLLTDGETKQNEKNWEGALKEYSQAVLADSLLQDTLQLDIEICKENLSKEMLSKAEISLSSLPAQLEKADEFLNKVRPWLTSQTEQNYNQLLVWLESLRKVDGAVRILQSADGLPEDALALLHDAENSWPAARSKDNLLPWKEWSNTLALWKNRELEQVAVSLGKLPKEILGLPRVEKLKRDLDIVRDLEGALKAQKYRDAALTARKLKDTSNDAMAGVWFDYTQSILQKDFSMARETDKYEKAEQIGTALLILLPDDDELRRQVASLGREHDEKYHRLVSGIEQDLNGWDLDAAASKLRNLQILASVADETSARLIAHHQDLVRLNEKMQVYLDGFESAFGKGDWQSAMRQLTDARNISGAHPRVDVAVNSLRKRLFEQVRAALTGNDFKLAEELRLKAAELKEDEEALELRIAIAEHLSAFILEQKRIVRVSLQAWDLEKADLALDHIQGQVSDDPGLFELRKKRSEIFQRITPTFDYLKPAWSNLKKAENSKALDYFKKAANEAPELEEIQAWISFTERIIFGSKAVELAVENENFHAATKALWDARQALELAPGKLLPSAFQGTQYIIERRREAIYHANRLYQSAREIETLYDEHMRYESEGNSEASLEKLDRLLMSVNRFAQSLGMTEPPADYSIGREPIAENVIPKTAGVKDLPARESARQPEKVAPPAPLEAKLPDEEKVYPVPPTPAAREEKDERPALDSFGKTSSAHVAEPVLPPPSMVRVEEVKDDYSRNASYSGYSEPVVAYPFVHEKQETGPVSPALDEKHNASEPEELRQPEKPVDSWGSSSDRLMPSSTPHDQYSSPAAAESPAFQEPSVPAKAEQEEANPQEDSQPFTWNTPTLHSYNDPEEN